MTEPKDPNLLPGQLAEGALPGDTDPRPGAWPLELPLDDPIARAAAAHDAEYMLHHEGNNTLTQAEADARLGQAMEDLTRNDGELNAGDFASAWNIGRVKVFEWIVNNFGWIWWK